MHALSVVLCNRTCLIHTVVLSGTGSGIVQTSATPGRYPANVPKMPIQPTVVIHNNSSAVTAILLARGIWEPVKCNRTYNNKHQGNQNHLLRKGAKEVRLVPTEEVCWCSLPGAEWRLVWTATQVCETDLVPYSSPLSGIRCPTYHRAARQARSGGPSGKKHQWGGCRFFLLSFTGP